MAIASVVAFGPRNWETRSAQLDGRRSSSLRHSHALFGAVCLGFVVVARDPKTLVNRLFALSMLTMIGWIGSISLYLSTRDTDPKHPAWPHRLRFSVRDPLQPVVDVRIS